MGNSVIKKGALISYSAVFLSIILTFFYTPWMIHEIGVSDYGLYTLITSFISYFIIDFGLSSSIARFIAKYRAGGDKQKIMAIISLTLRVYLIIDFVIFIALAVLYFFLSNIFDGLTPVEIEKLRVLYCIAAIFSILSFVLKPMEGAMMAYEYFVETKALDMVQKVGTIGLIVLILLLNGNVYTLVFVNGAVGFFVALIRFVIFKKKSGIKINLSYFDRQEMRSLFSFSSWVFISTLAQTFRLSFVPTILGIMANTVQISVFAVGRSIEGIVYTLSAALNGLFLLKVSMLIQADNRKAVSDLLIKVGRIQLYIISGIFFSFCIFGDVFLKLWVGTDFNDSYYVVIALIVTNIISLTQHIGNTLVYVENQVKYTALISIGTSLIGFLGCFLFASRLGAVGCALSICFCLLLNLIIINVFYKQKMKLDIRRFFLQCHFKILPLLIIFSIVFFLMKKYVISIDGWFNLICWAMIYMIGFGVISYTFLFNREEKMIIFQLFSFTLRIRKIGNGK